MLFAHTAAAARLARLKQELANGPSDFSTRSPHAKPEYSSAEFGDLQPKFDKLSWRMISKPGGATVKPDDFYRLYGLSMQVRPGVLGGGGGGAGGGYRDFYTELMSMQVTC